MIDLASAKEERKKQKKAAKEARRAEKRRRREERKRRRREEQGTDDEDEESPNEMEMIEMPDGQCIVNIKPKKPIKLKIKAPQTSNGVDSNGHASNNEEQPPPAKKIKAKRSSTSDTRSWCDSCSTDGTNGNLVRCDECQKCYHFWCLSPPVKKSPKVAGYGWQCNNCSPSEVDSDWHLD